MKHDIVNDVYYHRRPSWPRGVWKTTATPIDRVLTYVQEELGLEDRGGRTSLLRACDITQEVVTRHRKDKRPVLLQHLAVLSLYSGIPLAELAALGCVDVKPHARARGAV